MITIKLINLFIVLLGFASLMVAFACQVRSLRIKVTSFKMLRFYFFVACLGIICREMYILRFESGMTVQIWNLWGLVIGGLTVYFHPFKKESKMLKEQKAKE